MSKVTHAHESLETLKSELREMEKNFCDAAYHDGAIGWARYFSETGVMLSASSNPISGPEAIEAEMRDAFATKDFKLVWRPLHIDVSPDGTLGYTYGTYLRTWTDTSGNPVEATGKYMTVWKRQEDGRWLIEADIGN